VGVSILLLLTQLWYTSLLIAAQALTGRAAEVDPRAEVAAALYAASATQAAAEQVADARMRGQRVEIERLQTQLRAAAAIQRTFRRSSLRPKKSMSRNWLRTIGPTRRRSPSSARL
jgi:hypothetical protein